MAKKDGRMKAKCESYRRSGRREINKDLKAKKHLARIEHFAKRREEGKTYSYVPCDKSDKEEKRKRRKKNVDRRLPIQKWESLFAKLDYELQQEALLKKEKFFAKKKKKSA